MVKLSALAASLLLAACSQQTAPDQAAPSAVLARLPDAEAGDAAALEGKLALVKGCVVVESSGGVHLLALTHPAIRWDGAALTLRDGQRLAPGAPVMVGGSQASVGARLDWQVAPPPACTDLPVWIANAVVKR